MFAWMLQFGRASHSHNPVGVAIAAILGVFLSLPTQAADVTPAANATPATANEAPSEDLGEIVVSANRRAERLEDVGTSVTVESAEKLEELDIFRAEDLQKL